MDIDYEKSVGKFVKFSYLIKGTSEVRVAYGIFSITETGMWELAHSKNTTSKRNIDPQLIEIIDWLEDE
jgi:hypothetical protein